MRKIELEAWVLKVLDRFERNEPIEDSLVEVKAEWIDPVRAARRLAGHANAAQGENILWIIGVDETNHVICGGSEVEASSWFAQVKSEFDDNLAPGLTFQIPVTHENGATVVALLFETDRAPYVVKNHDPGRIQYEVPWREATAVRTARRRDLVRILIPLMKSPEIQVIRGSVNLKIGETDGSGFLSLNCYVVPRTLDRIVIPFHTSEARFGFAGSKGFVDFDSVTLGPPGYSTPNQPGPNPFSPNVEYSYSEVIINGPGQVTIAAFKSWSGLTPAEYDDQIPKVDGIIAEVSIRPAGGYNPTVIRADLKRTNPLQSYTDTWAYEETL
jgi:hypothetical protein